MFQETAPKNVHQEDGVPSPLQFFRRMGENPAIAKLRTPGKTDQPRTLSRSGDVRVKLRNTDAKVVVIRMVNGNCRFVNAELNINQVIPNAVLVTYADNGQTDWVSHNIQVANKSASLSIKRKDLKQFLLDAGIMNN